MPKSKRRSFTPFRMTEHGREVRAGGIFGVAGGGAQLGSFAVEAIVFLDRVKKEGSASRLAALDPHHWRVAGELGSADDVRSHHDQQGRVIRGVVLAREVVEPGNLAQAGCAADGAALLLVELTHYFHSLALFQSDDS